VGFTKLDSGIIDSSIWSEKLSTRVLWVTMLAKCNHVGFVAASRSGLLRASNISEQEFDEAISTLEAPDTDSRTPDHEGRRVEKVEGGWVVLNYKKYREFSYSDNPESVRKREQREKERDILGHVPKSTGHSASMSASLSNNKEGMQGGSVQKNTAFIINEQKIPYSFYMSVLKKCNNDPEMTGRVFYRAKCRATKNVIAWISSGLVKNKDDEYYALKSIREEDENPQAVREWIDKVVNRYTDA
jgi:hypothetical protein